MSSGFRDIDDKSIISSKYSVSAVLGVPKKCQGDFCYYTIEDNEYISELKHGSRMKHEIFKAKERHRKLTFQEQNENDNEGEIWKGDESFALDVGTNSEVLRKIPLKNILLARQEIDRLDSLFDDDGNIDIHNEVPWPESLKHWWVHIGQAKHKQTKLTRKSIKKSVLQPRKDETETIKKQLKNMIKNNHKRNSSTTNDSEDNDKEEIADNKTSLLKQSLRQSVSAPLLLTRTQYEEMTGKALTEEQSHLYYISVPSSDLLDKVKVSKDTDSISSFSTIHTKSSSKRKSEKIPFNLRDNPMSATDIANPSNLGHVSWYYSTALVCQNCYLIYGQINRLRDHALNRQNRGKSNVDSRTKEIQREEKQREKELKFKVMSEQQSKLIERLSQAKRVVETLEDSELDSNGKGNTVTAKGGLTSLPPLPWQLHDTELRDKYQSHEKSAFLRNIRNKAQQAAVIAHHEKYQNDHKQSLRFTEGDVRNGRYNGENESDYDYNGNNVNYEINGNVVTDNDDFKWKVATGQIHKPQDIENSKKREKKVITKKRVDPSRFMHPWQRDMEKIKKNLQGQGQGVADADDDDDESLNYYESIQKVKESEQIYLQSKHRQQQQPPSQSMDATHTKHHTKPPRSKPNLADFFQHQNKINKKLLPPLHQQDRLLTSPFAPSQDYANDYDMDKMDENYNLSSYDREYLGNSQDAISHSKFSVEKGNLRDSSSQGSDRNTGDTLQVTNPVLKPRSALLSQKSNRKKVVSFIGVEPSVGGTGVEELKSARSPKSPVVPSKSGQARTERDDDDEEDDDDEGIGWSPFVIYA